jgi:tetratricopeptide (TPR) repeat protein
VSAPEPESGYRLQMNRGGDLRRDGKLDAARAAFEEAARIAPASGAAHFNLALVLRDSGQPREAVLRFRAAARLDPRDFDAVQNVVLTIAGAVREERILFRGPPPAPAAAKAPGPGISIIVCSIDPARLARFRANVEGHLRGREHEIIAIGDARSLSEGYGRGLAQARHETVVFSHDDVELVSGDPFGEIEAALAQHDLVGLVGSRLAAGPAVLWSGHPHLHGWITYPGREGPGWHAAVMSLESGLLGGMQALDGVFMGARREAARRVGFDAETFDGFHFYDLDFTYRAHRSGLSLAVTTGIEAIHQSEGKFEDTWRHYAQRFHAKFPELNAIRAPAHWYGAQFANREELAAFYAELRALGSQP